MNGLSIVAVGHVHFESIETLTTRFAPVEELVLDIHPRSDLEKHRVELNRAIDAASHDWILIVREREVVDPSLADEVVSAAVPGESARAWGYRIRTVPLYRGKPLLLGDRDGELRLFHRRHFLRRGAFNVQGTVIRLSHSFQAASFETAAAQLEYLQQKGIPHSWLRRSLLFASRALASRTLDGNTLRYLWVDAGFDQQ